MLPTYRYCSHNHERNTGRSSAAFSKKSNASQLHTSELKGLRNAFSRNPLTSEHCLYHLHSTFPIDWPLTPLYGLYTSPVTFSCSTLSAENVCEWISKRICRAWEGRGAGTLFRRVKITPLLKSQRIEGVHDLRRCSERPAEIPARRRRNRWDLPSQDL